MVLRDLKRYPEAFAAFDQALRLDPRSRDALHLRGRLFFFLQRFDEAGRDFGQLLEIEPDRPDLRGLAFEVKLISCDWNGFDEAASDLARRVARREPVSHPLSFGWQSPSAELQFLCARRHCS